jgi:hypothetical protein
MGCGYWRAFRTRACLTNHTALHHLVVERCHLRLLHRGDPRRSSNYSSMIRPGIIYFWGLLTTASTCFGCGRSRNAAATLPRGPTDWGLTVNTERMMPAILAIVQWRHANGYQVNGR